MTQGLKEIFAAGIEMTALHPGQKRIVLALRLAVAHRLARQCPVGALTPVLGSFQEVTAFLKMVAEMARLWPEPVTVHRPCRHCCSHDELLLIDLVGTMARCDPEGFDSLLADYLPASARDAMRAHVAEFVAACTPQPRHAI